MALSREQSLIWQAMNIGPQWILRSEEDPLASACSEAPAVKPPAQTRCLPPPVAPALASSTAVSRTAPVVAARAAVKPVRSPARTSEAAAAATQEARADAGLLAELADARWEDIAGIVKRCHACPMSVERTRTVCADGAPGCPLVIVGEAPGRDEDLKGVPFVGKSGELLTHILEATGLVRGKDVAIVNVLKCRPPRNRDPRPDEVKACAAFLDKQLELLAPKVLMLMGRHAVERILGRSGAISRLRGQTFTVQIAGRPVPCIVTYHPSYLLRSPVEKEKGWHDVLAACELLAKASV